MSDAKVFERAAIEADNLANELGALRRENFKLRDEIERWKECLLH
jgi:FtsZ-binding cell division protein ZapB